MCGDPELSALDRQMGDYYAAALRRASPAERDRLRREQADLLRLRLACAGPGAAVPPERGSVTTCMRLLYARRTAQLAAAAPSVPQAIRAKSIKWADAKRHVQVDIAYPALVAGTPGGAAFDAFFERQARKWEARARTLAADRRAAELARLGSMPSAVDVTFEVVLATKRIVTVVSTGHEYHAHGARTLRFRTSTTFDVAAGRPLGEADVFAPGGKQGAVALALEKLRSSGEIEEEPLAACRKAASDLSSWAFGTDVVEVTFPVDPAAPQGKGERRIQLGYGSLGPFLRPDSAVLRR